MNKERQLLHSWLCITPRIVDSMYEKVYKTTKELLTQPEPVVKEPSELALKTANKIADQFQEKQQEEKRMDKISSVLNSQVGGSHYKDCKIQPVQYIEANELQFLEGCVVKRVTRHDKPTGKGRQDIEKAIHELQLLLELRYPEVEV